MRNVQKTDDRRTDAAPLLVRYNALIQISILAWWYRQVGANTRIGVAGASICH